MAPRDRLRTALDVARRAARELEATAREKGGVAVPPPGGPEPGGGSGPGTGGERGTVPGAPPVAPATEGIASPDPLQWIDAATVARLLGRPVGAPERVEDADTEGVRFRTADGVTLEISGLREEVLDRYAGDPARWIDERAAAAPRRFPVPDLGDYAVGTTGDDGVACYCWCTDACFVVRVDGAVGLDAVPEAVLRIMYDWPA